MIALYVLQLFVLRPSGRGARLGTCSDHPASAAARDRVSTGADSGICISHAGTGRGSRAGPAAARDPDRARRRSARTGATRRPPNRASASSSTAASIRRCRRLVRRTTGRSKTNPIHPFSNFFFAPSSSFSSSSYTLLTN